MSDASSSSSSDARRARKKEKKRLKKAHKRERKRVKKARRAADDDGSAAGVDEFAGWAAVAAAQRAEADAAWRDKLMGAMAADGGGLDDFEGWGDDASPPRGGDDWYGDVARARSRAAAAAARDEAAVSYTHLTLPTILLV